MIWLGLASVVLAAQPVQPVAEPPAERIVTMRGHPEQDDEDGERMVVRIDGSIRRFRLPLAQRESVERVLTADPGTGAQAGLWTQ